MASKLEQNVGGFGHAVVTAELHFVIVRIPGGDFRLCVFHGVPASSTWFTTGFRTVYTAPDLDSVKRSLDIIAGIEGAWKNFDIVQRVGPVGSTNYERTRMATLPPDAK